MRACKCVRIVLEVSAVDDTNVNGRGIDNQESVIGTGLYCRPYEWGVV